MIAAMFVISGPDFTLVRSISESPGFECIMQCIQWYLLTTQIIHLVPPAIEKRIYLTSHITEYSVFFVFTVLEMVGV